MLSPPQDESCAHCVSRVLPGRGRVAPGPVACEIQGDVPPAEGLELLQEPGPQAHPDQASDVLRPDLHSKEIPVVPGAATREALCVPCG